MRLNVLSVIASFTIMLAHAPIVATQDLVRKMNDEKYMELMDMPLTELVDEHIILLQKLKTMREGIENILKTHHFPFIISGMKMELKGLVEWRMSGIGCLTQKRSANPLPALTVNVKSVKKNEKIFEQIDKSIFCPSSPFCGLGR